MSVDGVNIPVQVILSLDSNVVNVPFCIVIFAFEKLVTASENSRVTAAVSPFKSCF